jgi:hypothetical protein
LVKLPAPAARPFRHAFEAARNAFMTHIVKLSAFGILVLPARIGGDVFQSHRGELRRL